MPRKAKKRKFKAKVSNLKLDTINGGFRFEAIIMDSEAKEIYDKMHDKLLKDEKIILVTAM